MLNPLKSAAALVDTRPRVTLALLLVTLVFAGTPVSVADNENRSQQLAQPATDAAVAPPPVTPGRPHASSADPHQQLPPEKLLQVALQHKQEGRPHEALSTLSMAIARYPDNAQLYSVRGSLYLEQHRFSLALQDLERSLALEPDDPAALTNRAQAYRQFGRGKEAMRDLDRAVALNPDLIPALFNRGVLRYSQGDLAGAREDFDRCIAVDPHMPAPYFNRAAILDALGDRPAAVADIERFIQIAGNDAWKKQAEDLLKFWAENPPVEQNNATQSVQ